ENAESSEKAGSAGAYEGALAHSNGTLVSRTHFARYLVEQGLASDERRVFKHYLVKGKPGFVAGQWAELAQAVKWIHDAGGVAVVAHPARYKMTRSKLRRLFIEFAELGVRPSRWSPAAIVVTTTLRWPNMPAISVCRPPPVPISTPRTTPGSSLDSCRCCPTIAVPYGRIG
ncbi:MAG: hypothetical protein AB2653_15880, partial [Candidatus Thiodiazotropha endolucinida]